MFRSSTHKNGTPYYPVNTSITHTRQRLRSLRLGTVRHLLALLEEYLILAYQIKLDIIG